MLLGEAVMGQQYMRCFVCLSGVFFRSCSRIGQSATCAVPLLLVWPLDVSFAVGLFCFNQACHEWLSVFWDLRVCPRARRQDDQARFSPPASYRGGEKG